MAARTPYNASGEADNGGGDPQQILRSCAESLLTAVARLEGGERSLTAPAQTPVARSSSPTTSSTTIEEHRRLFGYQTPSSGECKVFPVKNTVWTKLFVCLSRTNDQEVPSTSGKISLSFAGLGEKRSYFKRMVKPAMFTKCSWKNFLP